MNREEAVNILEPCRWARSSNYFGEDLSKMYCIVGRSRDSELVETSNWQVAQEILSEVDEDIADRVHGFNHWAVGWIDELMIPDDAPDDLLIACADIRDRLTDYSILDEEHYSQLELDTAINNINDACKSRGLDEPTISKVIEYLYEAQLVYQHDGNGYYPDDEHIDDATLCDGCSNLDEDTSHRCRADENSCVDGTNCVYYVTYCSCKHCAM